MASNKRSLSIDDYSVASVAKRRNFPLTIVEKVEILKRKYAGFPVEMIREKFNVSATTIYDIKRQQDKILKSYAESECITRSDKMRMKEAKNICKEMKANTSNHPGKSEIAIYFNSVTENFLWLCESDYAPTEPPTDETRLDFLYTESDLETDSESDNESDSESDCDMDMSKKVISMDEGTLQQKISIIEGIQPRENISLNEGIEFRENISLNEGIQLGKRYISFLEEWSFGTPHALKSIDRIQKKLKKEISTNEGIQSQENISINEEIQPQADVSTNEGIQSQENISINEEIQPQADVSTNEGIQSQENISINEEIQPQAFLSLYEGIQLGKCYIRFLKQRHSITQENVTRISKIVDKQIKKWPKHMRQETILDFFKKVPKK